MALYVLSFMTDGHSYAVLLALDKLVLFQWD